MPTRNVIKIGYTNKWKLDKDTTTQEFVDSIWDDFTYEVRLLFDYNQEEYIKNLVINEDVIRFDGQCETFLFERKIREKYISFRQKFNWEETNWISFFCKTNKQPYDKYIKAVLLIAEKYYGYDKLEIDYDKGYHGMRYWKDAFSLISSLERMKKSEVTGMKDSGHKLAVNDGRQFDNFGYIQ